MNKHVATILFLGHVADQASQHKK
uniref:Uncharacterized protein n=1 Tax=Arundo donax TaxID=35708 RepID=A0A0A9BDV8_ARUDO